MATDDGIIIYLDFTDGAAEPTSRDVLTRSFRSTTSSRRPGKAIEGTVVSFSRRVVLCKFCGGHRMDFDGPHSPQTTHEPGVVRDCVGRQWRAGKLLEGGT